MFYPVEWLKEFIDLKLPLEELAELLTMQSFETNIKESNGLVCLEVETLPNRGDCLSILGLSREIAAVLKIGLKKKEIKKILSSAGEIKKIISVETKDFKLCPRYMASFIKGVKIKPSPEAVQKRLLSAGIRPINNVVDATNYILLETGQPLHAFDADKISGRKIIVRPARGGEVITTLDGEERKLTSENLVIADEQKPVALAGVMGGANSEVTEATVNILLESAYFNPGSIRRTSSQTGLRTEASIRFEKGVDFANVAAALEEATVLIQKLGDGEIVAGFFDVKDEKKIQSQQIKLRTQRVSQVLGLEIKPSEIKAILNSLGLALVSQKENEFCFEVPHWRREDITREIDLIEEISRLNGYEKIKETLPAKAILLKEEAPTEILEKQIHELLTGAGFDEVINFSLGAKNELDFLSLPPDHSWRRLVAIKNPLVEDQSVLNPTLIIGICRNFLTNQNQQISEAGFFEIGHTFLEVKPGKQEEELKLAAGIMKKNADFFELKGVLEDIFDYFKISGIEFQRSTELFLHPGKSARISAAGEILGFIGELHPASCSRFGLNLPVVIFEISLDKLNQLVKKEKFLRPLPKFPAVFRDIALIIDKKNAYQEVIGIIQTAGAPLLEGAELFDIYEGTQIPEGHLSLAISLTFRHPDRTLVDAEVDQIHQKIVKVLQEKIGAKIR